MPSGRRLYGAITLQQQDLAWLNCTFDPATGVVKHEFSDCSISFFSNNKEQFAHSIRDLLRQKVPDNCKKNMKNGVEFLK